MPSLSISLKHLIKGMNRLPYLSMWTHDMNSASALLGEVSVWSLLVHIKGHPAKVMMNAEGGRAADFSGIGSAGHGGWWEEGGGEWAVGELFGERRWMGNRITKSNYKLCRTYTVRRNLENAS